MKRLKRYMSGITLKKQYIFKFILVMLLPLVTAEAVFYTLHVRSVEKDAVKLIEYRLAQSQQLVDARVKELMEIAVRVRADSRLRIDSLENDIHLRIQATTLLSAHNATNKLCQNIQIYYQPMDGVYSHEGFTGTEAFLKRRCRLSDEDAASLLDVLRHAVLPALALGLLTAGVFIRLVRTNAIATYNSGYVEAARSRGVSEKRLLNKHAWKPALIPIITVMGMQIALMLAGAVLTETTFEWKGLGFMLSQYLKARDFVAVQGIVILIAIIVAVVNFIVDVIAALVDPRVRY